MSELKKLLADGDPAAREPGLGDVDVRAMRQTMLVESRRHAASAPLSLWPRPIAVAAIVAACLVLGVGIGLRRGDVVSPVPSRVVTPASEVRRQLQITSPGGTRIIWTFHQELDL